jgi:putative oxidoreductase
MSSSLPVSLTAFSAGLLALRLVLGLGMAAHGSQKLFGWFGGHGLAATGGFFETIGFRPGRLFALRFLGPIGPALMLSVMIVAALTVHWKNGYFAQSNGIELTVMFAVGAVALAFTGFGEFSLDAVTGLAAVFSPVEIIGALGLGVLGGMGNLAMRRSQPPAVSAQT